MPLPLFIIDVICIYIIRREIIVSSYDVLFKRNARKGERLKGIFLVSISIEFALTIVTFSYYVSFDHLI